MATHATHAGAQASSGNGHDTFDEGSGSDPCDESQFDKMIAEWGLEPTKAYVRVARKKKKEVSEAAEVKRAYRATRKAEGFGQYVIERGRKSSPRPKGAVGDCAASSQVGGGNFFRPSLAR